MGIFEEVIARLQHEREPLCGIELDPPVTGWFFPDLDRAAIEGISRTVREVAGTMDFTQIRPPRHVPLHREIAVEQIDSEI